MLIILPMPESNPSTALSTIITPAITNDDKNILPICMKKWLSNILYDLAKNGIERMIAFTVTEMVDDTASPPTPYLPIKIFQNT